MNSLAQLGNRLTLHARALVQQVDIAVKKVALAVHEAVVRGTPVDTGKARSNWQVTCGDETMEVLDPYVPGSHLGIGEGANAAAAIAQGEAAVALRKPGQDIYIQNNVFYIGLLNEGWSAQAPAGFVQMAAVAGVDAMRAAKVVI